MRLQAPPVGASHLRRPRLERALDAAGPGRPVVVTAPAGFGKTALAATWVANRPGPVAWVSLADEDDGPVALARTLVAGVRAIDPAAGDLLVALSLDPTVPSPGFGQLLGAALARRAPGATLVLDDLHRITDPAALDLLGAVAAAAAPALTCVLLSRSTPPLPEPCAAAACRLHAADLAFAGDEAEALAALLGAVSAEAALAATAGWPAALRLLLARRGHRSTAGASLEAMLAFLIDETLASIAPALRTRLMHASVVESATPALLEALLPPGLAGDAAVSPADWAAVDPLLVAGGSGDGWLRVHDIARAPLLARLGDERRATHARAAAWFAQQGDPAVALRHALAAGDVAGAADLATRAAFAALEAERWDDFADVLAAVPETTTAAYPALLTLRCWRSYHRPTANRDSDLLAARTAVEALAAAGSDPALAARLGAHLGVLTFFDATPFIPGPALLDRAAEISDGLAPEDNAPRGILWGTASIAIAVGYEFELGIATIDRRVAEAVAPVERAILHCARALACAVVARDRDMQVRSLEAARDIAATHDLPTSLAFALTELGWADLEGGAIESALARFEEAQRTGASMPMTLWRRQRQGVAMAATMLGDVLRADRAAADIVDLVQAIDNGTEWLSAWSFRARISLLQGRMLAVREWLDLRPDRNLAEAHVFLESEEITRLRALLALDGAAQAAAVVAAAATYEAECRQGALHAIADAAVLCQVVALQLLGREQEAARLLAPALGRAADHRNVLAIAEFGNAPVRLFDRLRRRRGIDPAFLAAVRALAHRIDGQWPAPSSLTERELLVLRALDDGAAFDEIAAMLVVEPASARSYASRAYRRLGVTNRQQALATARALGILRPAP